MMEMLKQIKQKGEKRLLTDKKGNFYIAYWINDKSFHHGNAYEIYKLNSEIDFEDFEASEKDPDYLGVNEGGEFRFLD